MNTTGNDAGAIERELKRLNVQTTHTRPEGISVYASENDTDAEGTPLPSGYARVSDGTGEAVGPCDQMASRLSEVQATGRVTDDGTDVDWEATWEALNEFPERVE